MSEVAKPILFRASFLVPRSASTFGPSRLTLSPPPLFHVSAGRPSRLRARVRALCPQSPGVYGMVDYRGELIYVGKAKRLRTRLLCYFRRNSRDPKAGRIIARTRAVVWEPAANEFAALVRELELIHRWQPCCNVQGQPGRKRRTFICLGRRPAPYAFLSRRPPSGVLAAFGPVHAGHSAREAVRRLNDVFGLRDCPQKQEMCFADQNELFPEPRAAGCLRFEIGTCLGPCAAACTTSTYAARVRAARAFLAGTDDGPLQELERTMAAASVALEFERAAALRDKLTALHWLRAQVDRARAALERHSFVYPLRGHDGQELWYLIRRGRVVSAQPAPVDEDGRRRTALAIRAVYAAEHGATSEPSAGFDEVFLVAGWFRRHPAEQARTLPSDAALARCHATDAVDL